ncbi:MAG: hypothetical protein U0176_06535 [Bacteroidia bacterium]
MKRIFSALALLILAAQAFAQEVMISDSSTIPPFEGVIGYRIRYEGKVNPAMRPYLPDSATLHVGKNGLLYHYHGGQSGQMQAQVVWDGEAQTFWLLDSTRHTANSTSELWPGYIPVAKKTTDKPIKVAGRTCNSLTLTTEKVSIVDKKVTKEVEKIWVNDSIRYGGQLVDSLKKFQPAFLGARIWSIPLMTKRTQAGEVTTVMEAITITPSPQDKWMFKVPEGFRTREFDPSKLIHPILEPKTE